MRRISGRGIPGTARDRCRPLLDPAARNAGFSDVKRLKMLGDENAKLKRLLADAMLDRVIGTPLVRVTMARAVLKELLGKNRR